MKNLFAVLFLCFFVGCNKPDATPETSDEIYGDLLQELDVANKGLESEIKNLEKLQQEQVKVVPQTGQIKFSQKKIFETQNTIAKLQQQKQFFEIKVELRKNEVRDRYLAARRGGKPWPDLAEIQNYKSTIKLQRDKLTWEKTKGMKKDVPRGTKEKAAPSEGEQH